MKKLKIFSTLIALLFLSMGTAMAGHPVKRNVETIAQELVIANTSVDAPSIDMTTGVGGFSDTQIISIVLCFFLGYLGIHRFYMGYTTVGIIQLLTLGGFGIWTLIDFIRLLMGDLGPK
ncbi:MAG: hypothetical protein ACJAY8_000543 [Sphingobacteriales bacterium]|jgi:hypothetical protein